MIRLEYVYILAGLMFGAFSVQHALDRANPRRWRSAVFWGAYAITFLVGSELPDTVNGVLVLIMVLLAGVGGLQPGVVRSTSTEERRASAARLGNRLFLPALVIPAVAVFGTLFLKCIKIGGVPLVAPAQVTIVALALGVICALIVGMAMLRAPLEAPLKEGRRLIDSVGWAAVLPQMLAALGALFALAGVGHVVAKLVTDYVPMTSSFVAVTTFTVGMALFTIIMGNAFAAFPVMITGIGLPFLVTGFHGNPVVVASLGMLSGFCGTLLTPMAANYNIVPAALLELKDRYGVIRVQAATGVMLLVANTLLMYFFAFPK
jgi:uncharacterized membrane protein